MIATNCYISFHMETGFSSNDNLLCQINMFTDENPGDDVRPGDVVSDFQYNEYQVVSIVTKYSPQNYDLIVEDIRKTYADIQTGQGIIFTPTPKWRLGRVGTSVAPDQFRAVFDESMREVIDENLGGLKDAVKLYTITSDDVSQGFIDITNISPVPADNTTLRLNVIGGIEQVNADAPGTVWGITPDFQVISNSSWKRLVFKNYGQPTVPLSGHLDVDDTVQIVYLYKP